MTSYKEIRAALINLCQKEGLRYIETKLTNRGICFVRDNNRVILNLAYKNLKGRTKGGV